MRQFRILHSESSVGWGGQEHRVFLELDWMRQNGHEVCLASPAQAEVFRRSQNAEIPALPTSFKRQAMAWEVLRLVRFLRDHRFDVVNTHSSRDSWTVGLAARLAGVPCIIRSRHIEVDYANALLTRVNFELLHDYTLTTSQRIADRLVAENGLDPHRIECLATGVDLSKYAPRQGSNLQHELGLPESTPLVGMVSVIRSWKGHRVFLDAARQLVEAGSPAHFTMTGGEMGRDWLRRTIDEMGLKGRAHYIGYREDVPDVLASLNILVLPSTAHEGVPQAILQAHAMERPVIGSRVGGIPEVIQHEKNGLLVAPGDARALARAIQQTLDDPKKAVERAKQGRQLVEQHHSVDAMGLRLLEVYETLVPDIP